MLNLNMKKIKQNNINPCKLISKAEYARRQGISHTEVNRMIKRGDVVIIITLDNKELVHL